MNLFLTKITGFFLSFVKFQLFVSLVSLPFLAYWGIPISLMSMVGNFIFTPFLTIFLILSTLIFFTELCAIPNAFFISALTITTSWWEWLLHLGNKLWLIGLAKPNTMLTVLFLVLVVLLLFRFVFRIMSKLILAAIVVMLGLIVTQYHQQVTAPPQNKSRSIPRCFKKLFVSQTPEKTINLTDDGLFAKKPSPEKFVIFELTPYLIKEYGTTTIENISLNKPGLRSFKATQELCETFSVKKVSIANNDKKATQKHFFALQKTLQEKGIEITRFET